MVNKDIEMESCRVEGEPCIRNPPEAKNEDTGNFTVGSKDDPLRWKRIIKQCVIVASMIGFGMSLEVVGPTMTDLKDILGVAYSDLSHCIAARSVGTLVGTLLAGYTLERFRNFSDAIFGLTMIAFGTLTAVIPVSCCLWLEYPIFILCGFTEAFVNIGGSTMVIHLWQTEAAAPLHLQSFGFSVGAAITPNLVRPFLSPDRSMIYGNSTLHTDTIIPADNSTTTTDYALHESSRIEIAYMIIGIYDSIFGLVFIMFHFGIIPLRIDGNNRERQEFHNFFGRLKSMINPALCGYGNFTYGFVLLTCMFLYFIISISMYSSLRNIFAFAIETPLQMSKSEATNLVTVYFSCALVGRLVGVLFAKYLPINIYVIINVLLIFATCVVMAIYGHYIRQVMWAFVALAGLFTCQLWPNGVAWANRYLKMNSLGVMVLIIGKSCGLFVVNFIVGLVFDTNPRYLSFVFLACAGLLVSLVGVMNIVIYCHNNLIKQQDDTHDNQSEDKTDVTPEINVKYTTETTKM